MVDVLLQNWKKTQQHTTTYDDDEKDERTKIGEKVMIPYVQKKPVIIIKQSNICMT